MNVEIAQPYSPRMKELADAFQRKYGVDIRKGGVNDTAYFDIKGLAKGFNSYVFNSYVLDKVS